MTPHDYLLEILAYPRAFALLHGDEKPAPDESFMEKARDFQHRFAQGESITPEELGWE